MQPKQKRTFGILFPWSALWLMVCQFRALGSLHSNCQGYKARGSSECRVTDVPEGWVKKKKKDCLCLVCAGGFQDTASSRAFSACILIFSPKAVVLF